MIAGKNRMIAGENRMIAGKNRMIAGENRMIAGENRMIAGENRMIAGENFYKGGMGGGGGGDVKGCMLNTGVGYSASASYSLLMSLASIFEFLSTVYKINSSLSFLMLMPFVASKLLGSHEAIIYFMLGLHPMPAWLPILLEDK